MTETGWTRERFYAAPPNVRISIRELADALGRSTKTVYRMIDDGMPCRVVRGGIKVIVIGHAREWLEARERVVNPRARVGRAS